jgi:hypothetical protein
VEGRRRQTQLSSNPALPKHASVVSRKHCQPATALDYQWSARKQLLPALGSFAQAYC